MLDTLTRSFPGSWGRRRRFRNNVDRASVSAEHLGHEKRAQRKCASWDPNEHFAWQR